MKRREFFRKGGALFGGAVLGPQIVNAKTLGLSGSPGANSRINIGLVGNGLIMRGHRGYYASRDRTRVVAVCDLRESARKKARKEVETEGGYNCDAYHHFEEMLERPDLDAVVVGTPDHWHAAVAIAAMRAGKDVYVEKPMTLTLRESMAMVEAQKRYGRVVQVGSQQRSSFEFRRAVEIIRNGWIGELKAIYARLGSFPAPFLKEPERVPEGFDYDKWLGPTPFEPYFEERAKGVYSGGWRCFWEYGSRKQGDWGAHHFDIIQWALDMDHSGPTNFVPKGYMGSPYQYHEYENGLRVYRDHDDMRGHMIRFIGEEGEVLVSRNGIESDPPSLVGRSFAPGDERVYRSDDHRANWLDCIQSRKQPICHVEVGHRSGSICLLNGISERLQRPIEWDPVKQEIIGDPEAARMMDRPRRDGYPLPS